MKINMECATIVLVKGGHTMFTLFRIVIKIALLPIKLPLYLLWALFGGMLGGRHRVYDMWTW